MCGCVDVRAVWGGCGWRHDGIVTLDFVEQDRSVPDGSLVAPVRFEGFTFVAPRALDAPKGGALGVGGRPHSGSGVDGLTIGSSGRRLEFVPPVPVLHPDDPVVPGDVVDVGPIGSWTEVGGHDDDERMS